MSDTTPLILPELLTTREAARLCSMGERTFWRHAHSGVVPAGLKIGGSVRFRRADLLRWIEEGCPRCDSQAGAAGEASTDG